MLYHTQLLDLEITDTCNMQHLHPLCPSSVSRLGELMTEDMYVRLSIDAYLEHRFNGLICFHWYGNCDFPSVTSCYNKNLSIVNANFDGRCKEWNTNEISNVRCLRPLIEFAIDSHGNARLCCQDWKGNIDLGSVWTNSFKDILIQRKNILEKICANTMSTDSPERCLRCDNRVNYPSHKGRGLGFVKLMF